MLELQSNMHRPHAAVGTATHTCTVCCQSTSESYREHTQETTTKRGSRTKPCDKRECDSRIDPRILPLFHCIWPHRRFVSMQRHMHKLRHTSHSDGQAPSRFHRLDQLRSRLSMPSYMTRTYAQEGSRTETAMDNDRVDSRIGTHRVGTATMAMYTHTSQFQDLHTSAKAKRLIHAKGLCVCDLRY
jgi:hypothetical protein